MATFRTLPPGFNFTEWAALSAARRNARKRARGSVPSPAAAATAAAPAAAPSEPAVAASATRQNPQVVRVQPVPMQPSEFDRVRNLARRLDDDARLELINEIIPKGVEQCGVCHRLAFSCAMFPSNPYGEFLQCRACAAEEDERHAVAIMKSTPAVPPRPAAPAPRK